MLPPVVVPFKELRKAGAALGNGAVPPYVDVVVLDRSPQPLDKHVIQRPPSSVHADPDTAFKEHRGELLAGELTSLIRVEDFRFSVLRQCLLENFDAEAAVQRGRQTPCKDAPTVPVDNGAEVSEAAVEADVGDIGAPHLVGVVDHYATKQIRVLLVCLIGLRGVQGPVDRVEAHTGHQPANLAAPNLQPKLTPHGRPEPSGAPRGVIGE